MKNSAFLLILVSFSFASAFFISSSGGAYTYVYNAQIEEIPSPLRFLFSGEKANVHVSGLGEYYTAFGDRGEAIDFGEGNCPEAGLEITLNKKTLSRINSGELSLDDAVRTKQLILKSNNLSSMMKLQIALGFINAGGIWENTVSPPLEKLVSFLPF